MHIQTPLTIETVEKLHAGDRVLITGTIYTARDAAHARLIQLIDEGKPLPFPLENAIIYYVGPAPAKPNQVIGSAGPTTSSRMDKYTIPLLMQGLRGMIGKGERNDEVKKALTEYKGVYFAAVGGAAALIARTIKKSEVIAFEDLGAEAIRKLEVENFPAIVINDIYGHDLMRENYKHFQKGADICE